MEALGVITHVEQPTDLGIVNYLCTKGKQWTSLMSRSTWPQQSNLPQSPQDAYCRRSHTQIHKFTLLHQAWCTSWILVHSPWWRIKSLNYLQKPLWEVPFPASSPLVWSAHRTSSRRRLTSSLESAPDVWELLMTSLYMVATEAEHDAHLHNLMQVAHKYGVVFNPQKTHVKGPSHKLLWLPIQCQWCTPESREGWCCACSPSTHKCHWTPRVPWHGDISQSPSSVTCPPLLPLCKNSWKKMLTSSGMPAMRLLLSQSSKPLSATPPSDTSTCHCLWPYKLMLPR